MRRWSGLWFGLLLVAVSSCGPSGTTRFTVQGPPDVRVGLRLGVAQSEVACTGSFTLSDEGGVVAAIPAGEPVQISGAGDGILLELHGRTLARGPGPYRFSPDNKNQLIQVAGKSYPGFITVRRNTISGLNIINVVDLENYLRSVLPKEIPSAGKYQQAARAQAVAARTYALNKLGQHGKEGFDLHGGVLDQVYGSIDVRNPTADEAVAGTRGQVLLFKGRLIEAKYGSTCGGKIAGMNESFNLKTPYLRSGADKLGGQDACRKSKYHRWEVVWTGDAFWSMLAGSIPDVLGKPLKGSFLKEVKVTKRGKSGRAMSLRIKTDEAQYTFTKEQIRSVLRRQDGGMLRSTAFKLNINWRRNRMQRVKINGQGWGHGVGMCQWGAMEFSAVGKDYAAILRHYYPKTQLERLY